MNKEELQILNKIASNQRPWLITSELKKHLATIVPEEAPESPKLPAKRTDSQNKAYWLWLTQIAQICQNEGVTADMVFKHTAHISVTKELLHHCVKTLIKAKWNLESTTELDKTGHLDSIQEHIALWLGKEGVEIPPWPSDQNKEEIQMYAKPKSVLPAYPEDIYNGESGSF